MEQNKESCSVSSAKRNLVIDKDCKHKFKVVYGKKQICVKCGFIKWW